MSSDDPTDREIPEKEMENDQLVHPALAEVHNDIPDTSVPPISKQYLFTDSI